MESAPLRPSVESDALSRAANIVSLVLIAAILYVARDLLIPIALAILLSFLLAPLILRVQRHGVPRSLSVMLVAGALFSILGLFAWVTVVQLTDLARSLPSYESNIRLKAESLQGTGSVLFERVGTRVEQLSDLIATSSPAAGSSDEAPLLVQVVEPAPSTLAVIQGWLGPLLAPFGTAGLVVVIVLFMLLQWSTLRDRMMRVTSQGHLSMTTEAFDDAARRISHYLLAQFAINVGTGLIVGVGLFLIGIPNAPLWGLFSMLFRYIPFVGPWLAALPPLLVAVVVSPGWVEPLLALALFLSIEFISNTFIEPWAYGSSTGVSSLGILISAITWSAMWGPVGLILATPMTVCLVVMGRYVPQLSLFYVLLGDQPALSPAERLYHRLLALDMMDAAEEVAAFKGEGGLVELFTNLLVPTVMMAERDRQVGELQGAREEFVYTNLHYFIESAGSQHIPVLTTVQPSPPDSFILPPHAAVCVPAGDAGDALGSLMLAHLLGTVQQAAIVLGDEMLLRDKIDLIGMCEADTVFISVMPPYALRQPRDLCRELRSHYPHLKIIVVFWARFSPKSEEMLRQAGASQVVGTLADVTQVVSVGQQLPTAAQLADTLSETLLAFQSEQAEALLRTAMLGYSLEEVLGDVIQPALYQIGAQWASGQVSVEQEHFASDFIRTQLIRLTEQLSPVSPDDRRAIAACAPDEEHEIGLLLITLLLRQHGWHVIYLGQRVPGEGLTALVRTVEPHLLLFSASQPHTATHVAELGNRLQAEGLQIPLIFGGQGFGGADGEPLAVPGVVVRGDARQAIRYIVEHFNAPAADATPPARRPWQRQPV